MEQEGPSRPPTDEEIRAFLKEEKMLKQSANRIKKRSTKGFSLEIIFIITF